MPRPQLGDLVPQFNSVTTLYGKALRLEVSAGGHRVSTEWHEVITRSKRTTNGTTSSNGSGASVVARRQRLTVVARSSTTPCAGIAREPLSVMTTTSQMSEPETFAALDLTCAECGRIASSRRDMARLLRDRVAREAVTYCPACAEREFGPSKASQS